MREDIQGIIDAAYLKCGGPVYANKGRLIARHGRTDKASQRYNEGSKAITARDVLEFVPVVGDVLAAEEVYRELQKEPVNWTLVGILTAGTAVGLIPGIGDAAANAIKKGGKALLSGSQKAINELKRYDLEIDTSTLGMSGGNIKIVKRANTPVSMSAEDIVSKLKQNNYRAGFKADSKPMVSTEAENSKLLRNLHNTDKDKFYKVKELMKDEWRAELDPTFWTNIPKKAVGELSDISTFNTEARRVLEEAYTGKSKLPDAKKIPAGSRKVTYEGDKNTPEIDKMSGKLELSPEEKKFAEDAEKARIKNLNLFSRNYDTGVPEVDNVIPFIKSEVRKLMNKRLITSSQDANDAIQRGIEAALESKSKFKPGSNNSFFTYAHNNIKWSIRNKDGLGKEQLKREWEAGPNKGLDAPINTSEGQRPLSEVIPGGPTKNFYDQLPPEHRKLARLLNEQYDSRSNKGGGNLIREGNKVTRQKVLKDKDIAAELGISLEEFANRKAKLKVVMKEFLDDVDIKSTLRPGRPSQDITLSKRELTEKFGQPSRTFEGAGKAGEVNHLIVKGVPTKGGKLIGKSKGSLIQRGEPHKITEEDYYTGWDNDKLDTNSFDIVKIDDLPNATDNEIAQTAYIYQVSDEGKELYDVLKAVGPDRVRNAVFKHSLGIKELYDRLPQTLKVYRGHTPGKGIGLGGLSWSLDRNIAEEFGDTVEELVINKKDIATIIPGHELELIIDPDVAAK